MLAQGNGERGPVGRTAAPWLSCHLLPQTPLLPSPGVTCSLNCRSEGGHRTRTCVRKRPESWFPPVSGTPSRSETETAPPRPAAARGRTVACHGPWGLMQPACPQRGRCPLSASAKSAVRAAASRWGAPGNETHRHLAPDMQLVPKGCWPPSVTHGFVFPVWYGGFSI